jgi:hypothetical protein
MVGRLIAEAGPGRVCFGFLLRQAHDLAWIELEAVQAEPLRVDAVVSPALVACAQIEELARRVTVAVEIHAERRLLRPGQRSSE